MSLVEPIPLQTKIAELEQRIEKLEKERSTTFTRTTIRQTRHSHGPSDGIFGDSWDKLWENFHKVMKAAFR